MAHARIYIRRSDDDQSTYSPEAQARECRRWCAEHDHEVIEPPYVDDDLSGRREDRPRFQQLLSDAKADPGSLIVAHKFDRIARDTEALLRIIYKELLPRRVQVESVMERIDPYTPLGKMMLTVSGGVSTYHVDNLSTEVKKGLREKAERGGWIGLPPYGYQSVYEYDRRGERVRGSDRLIPSDDADTARLIFNLYASGNYSDSSLRDELNERGITLLHPKTGQRVPFQRDSIGGILRNPAYIGVVRCGHQWYDGAHVPLIDRSLWDRCQAIRARRTAQRGGRAPVRGTGGLLSEIAFCGHCGARLRWWIAGNQSKGRQGYYRCAAHVAYGRLACDAPMIQARRIEALVLALIGDLDIPAHMRDQVIFEVNRRCHARAAPVSPDQARTRRQLERLKADWRAGDRDDLDDATYRSERRRLEHVLMDVAPASQVEFDVPRALALLRDAPALLAASAMEQRRGILQQVMEVVWLEKEQVTAVRPSPVLLPLLVAADHLSVTSTGIEPSPRRSALWLAFATPALPTH